MSFQRLKDPVIAVPRYGKQSRLHVLAVNGTVKGAESVHQRFELGGHAVVVERGHKYHHVRPQNLPTDGLYIVLLNTGTLISAVDAAGTGVDAAVGYIDEFHRMSALFSPPGRMIPPINWKIRYGWDFPVILQFSLAVLLIFSMVSKGQIVFVY